MMASIHLLSQPEATDPSNRPEAAETIVETIAALSSNHFNERLSERTEVRCLNTFIGNAPVALTFRAWNTSKIR